MAMTAKTLVDAVVRELRGAASTQLALAKVYKGDQPAWADKRGIFVVWTGGPERPRAIGDNFIVLHDILVVIRMPVRDDTGTTAEADWYDAFLDLCQEVYDELTELSNRRITDANGAYAEKLEVGSGEFGYAGEGSTEMWGFVWPCSYSVPQN